MSNPTYDRKATLHVFTYKQGLLARLAHDLRLSLLDFEVTCTRAAITARVRTSSLCLDGVAHGERIDAAALSDHDARKILATARDLLEADRHPEAAFDGTLLADPLGGYRVQGRFRLRGREHELSGQVTESGGRACARLSFAPSSFGIAPYAALAGAIRLQDRVEVSFCANTAGLPLSALLTAAEPVRFTP